MEIAIASIVVYLLGAVVTAFIAGKTDPHGDLGPAVMLACITWPAYLILLPFYLIYSWARDE